MVERWSAMRILCVPDLVGQLACGHIGGVVRRWCSGQWSYRVLGRWCRAVNNLVRCITFRCLLERSDGTVEVLEVLAPPWVVPLHVHQIRLYLRDIE